MNYLKHFIDPQHHSQDSSSGVQRGNQKRKTSSNRFNSKITRCDDLMRPSALTNKNFNLWNKSLYRQKRLNFLFHCQNNLPFWRLRAEQMFVMRKIVTKRMMIMMIQTQPHSAASGEDSTAFSKQFSVSHSPQCSQHHQAASLEWVHDLLSRISLYVNLYPEHQSLHSFSLQDPPSDQFSWNSVSNSRTV